VAFCFSKEVSVYCTSSIYIYIYRPNALYFLGYSQYNTACLFKKSRTICISLYRNNRNFKKQ